jgi:hypothetical protein
MHSIAGAGGVSTSSSEPPTSKLIVLLATRASDPVVTRLGQRLQIVPRVKQVSVPAVGFDVVHDFGRPIAAASAKRMLCQESRTELLPAPAIPLRVLGATR